MRSTEVKRRIAASIPNRETFGPGYDSTALAAGNEKYSGNFKGTLHDGHHPTRRFPLTARMCWPRASSIFPSPSTPPAPQASKAVAQEIAALIDLKAARGEKTVLGLATGSTPTGVYDELVRLHREEGLSFKNVITFNLDEYWPMNPDDLQSYRRFMNEHLFDHIDILPQNAHVPDGTVPLEKVGGVLPGIRAEDPRRGRTGLSDPGHRPHRAYRL